MSDPAPLISFAIPAYNRPALLAEAIASIAAIRTSLPMEIVICDDGLEARKEPAHAQRVFFKETAAARPPEHASSDAPGSLGMETPDTPKTSVPANPSALPQKVIGQNLAARPMRAHSAPESAINEQNAPGGDEAVDRDADTAGSTHEVWPGVVGSGSGAIPESLLAACARAGTVLVRYFPNVPSLGAVGNWNRCLREARGAWVTVLHEDDLLYPNYLELVAPRLKPDVAAVAVKTDQGAEPPRAGGASPPLSSPEIWRYWPRYFIKSSMTPFPGVIIRRELALKLGGFDERWGPLADYEFWYRLACAGAVELVRETGAFYRVAPGQWTERAWIRMVRLTHLLRLRIVREQFPRQRRLGLWLARFFTHRNAQSYALRFGQPSQSKPRTSPALARALRLGAISGARLPAGWVWQAVKGMR